MEDYMTDLQEFIDYVWSFYNDKDGIYPIKGLTTDHIFTAIKEYARRINIAKENNNMYFNVTYSWGDGDSLDRERVRDILLDNPNLKWTC
tara:strand:- start:262 stop:531 length:270 start_codon:yes stop_codon:yes gene_type:complete